MPLNSRNGANSARGSKFKRAAQGSADQFCIAADLAATLLHELVHSCWATSGSADHPPGTKDAANRCSTSYLIENSFRWALGQRYPCLGSSTDCNFYIKSCMWRNDGISYPGNSPC